MKTDFSNAQIGDRVWSILHGWGKIIKIDPISTYPISFLSEDGRNKLSFTLDGLMDNNHVAPTLFWDEIKIEAPFPPKRKVRRFAEGWINIYYGTNHLVPLHYTASLIYKTKEEADSHSSHGRLGEAYFIRHEYEEEE